MMSMSSRHFSKWPIKILFIAVLLLVTCRGIMAESVHPLDRETVFCLYFKMSGEALVFQDIEDLYHAGGKPTFSAYKPAELFIKHSLERSRIRLLKRVADCSANDMFALQFNWSFNPDRTKHQGSLLATGLEDLPHPTHFIRSELSKDDQRALERALRFLAEEKLNLKKETPLRATVYLVPEKTERHIEKRIIALEQVFLPIRKVVFRPAGIGLYQGPGPEAGIRFYGMKRPPVS
ncbi:MAG: hypothetical protein ABII06_16380 [Pseudomonadota bacterium]